MREYVSCGRNLNLGVGPDKKLTPFVELVLTCADMTWSLADTGDQMKPGVKYETERFIADVGGLRHLIEYLLTVAKELAAMEAALPGAKPESEGQ